MLYVLTSWDSGGPDHDRLGFRYWKNPGPFVNFDGITGNKGHFLGWWAVMTQASFSFIGTEIVAVWMPVFLVTPEFDTVTRLQLVKPRTLDETCPRQSDVSTSVSSCSILGELQSLDCWFHRMTLILIWAVERPLHRRSLSQLNVPVSKYCHR